jgi:hypothetical protein
MTDARRIAELRTKTCEQRGRTLMVMESVFGGGCRRVGWFGEVQPSECVRTAVRPGEAAVPFHHPSSSFPCPFLPAPTPIVFQCQWRHRREVSTQLIDVQRILDYKPGGQLS